MRFTALCGVRIEQIFINSVFTFWFWWLVDRQWTWDRLGGTFIKCIKFRRLTRNDSRKYLLQYKVKNKKLSGRAGARHPRQQAMERWVRIVAQVVVTVATMHFNWYVEDVQALQCSVYCPQLHHPLGVIQTN